MTSLCSFTVVIASHSKMLGNDYRTTTEAEA